MSYMRILWGIAFFIFCIEVIWISAASFSFHYSLKNYISEIWPLAILLLTYIFYKNFVHQKNIVFYIKKIPLILESVFFLCVYLELGLVLSYLAVTVDQPFADHLFASADSYLGINSASLVLWFQQHRIWNNLFSIIYDTHFLQFPIIVLYFGLRGEEISLQRFLMLFVIAVFFTITISGFLPAEGPYVWYHYTPSPELLNALNQVHDLRNNTLDISKSNGIITFPSFHTILALLYTYVLRKEKRVIFLPFLILNTLMIFSCLPIGQHYFVDLLGGGVVFLLTVWIEKHIFSYVTSHNSSTVCPSRDMGQQKT